MKKDTFANSFLAASNMHEFCTFDGLHDAVQGLSPLLGVPMHWMQAVRYLVVLMLSVVRTDVNSKRARIMNSKRARIICEKG